jgi:hypothetical protein
LCRSSPRSLDLFSGSSKRVAIGEFRCPLKNRQEHSGRTRFPCGCLYVGPEPLRRRAKPVTASGFQPLTRITSNTTAASRPTNCSISSPRS